MVIDVPHIPWHISQDIHLIVAPVRHAAKYTRQITKYSPGVITVLNINVATKTRLRPTSALAIWYLLIAILGDTIKLPFVYLSRINSLTQPEALVQNDVVINPGRIIRPCPFSYALPCTRVSAGFGIRSIRYTDDSPFRIAHNLRNAIGELLCVKLHIQQRCVNVAKFGVNNFSNGHNAHGVDDIHARGIRRDSANPQLPSSRGFRKIDAVTALIKRRGFVINSTVNHRFIRPTIDRQIDSILNAGADFITVVFLE